MEKAGENALQTPIKERKATGVPFTKNDPRINLAGRPKGSISPITRVKQIFEQDPDKFADFINAYIKDPGNRKHIVEMLDGKPRQTIGLDGGEGKPIPIMEVKRLKDEENQPGSQEED